MRLGWRNVSAVKARLTQQNCKNYESKVMRNAIPCEDPQCSLQTEAFLLYSNRDIHSTICNLQPPEVKCSVILMPNSTKSAFYAN